MPFIRQFVESFDSFVFRFDVELPVTAGPVSPTLPA
jgi:hypothetical protein